MVGVKGWLESRGLVRGNGRGQGGWVVRVGMVGVKGWGGGGLEIVAV